MEDSKDNATRGINKEKDLGIYIVDSVKPSLQCTKLSVKAMSVTWLIKRKLKGLASNG